MPTTFRDEMKPAIPHTPGPWRYLRHDGVIVHDQNDHGAREIGWNDADYMLAAAAPELLAALKVAFKYMEKPNPTHTATHYKHYDIVRFAIAKAEGR